MKKLLFAVVVIFTFYSCDVESTDVDNLESVAGKAKEEKKEIKVKKTKIIKECLVVDVDRCPFEDRQPKMNFWWPEDGNQFFNLPDYFGSTDEHQLTYVEYDNGTAHISGTTSMGVGDCLVEVDVWLKDEMSWEDWSATEGEHKKEGCAGDASNSTDLRFYTIDSEKSTLTSVGGGCLGEGTFGLEQRPDPIDDTTPNYGVHIGPGGANYDSEIGAVGLSTWGWITDIETGEHLWVMDFNFKLDCADEPGEGGCETAFARGNNGNTCFIGNGFNRWGWTIGPLSEGAEESYEIYAGAGQCDINKGELAGTVDVSYIDGVVNVVYNIDESYEVGETHTYAGNEMFPTKNGKPTVAPGQYSITENLSGDIYVIAHAVVCAEE